MNGYNAACQELKDSPKLWGITGVAGFIGSNLLETLLKLNQSVVGIDNFATGHQSNLDEVKQLVTDTQWKNFRFISGDIRNQDDCKEFCINLNFVLHQAALGSVPRSINDPVSTNLTNINGFLNVLEAAKQSKVQNFIYASSSSVYGDHLSLPKVEDIIGRQLSPYAVTKYVNELYADVFSSTYSFRSIGLRYFNVFGARQDPNGAYAAVIPKWVSSLIKGQGVTINGDGSTSRDFCFIENVVQANILAAVDNKNIKNEVFNVACGRRTTLNQLYSLIASVLETNYKVITKEPVYNDFRAGDVRHSHASIKKAKTLLGYSPTFDVIDGLNTAIPWYLRDI